MVRIPERKFGARVTRKQQLQAIQQREQQADRQRRLQEQRKEVQETRREVAKQPVTVLVDGKRFTESELRQAESLIFRGRQFAARGDPRLQDLIGRLQRGGQRSAGEIIAQEKIKRQIRIEEQKTEARRETSGFIDPQVLPRRFETGSAFLDEFISPREVAQVAARRERQRIERESRPEVIVTTQREQDLDLTLSTGLEAATAFERGTQISKERRQQEAVRRLTGVQAPRKETISEVPRIPIDPIFERFPSEVTETGTRFLVPPPSRRELGIKEKSLAEQITGFVGAGLRDLTNDKTFRDIVDDKGIFVQTRLGETTPIRIIPTGTIVDPKLIKTEVPIKEFIKREFATQQERRSASLQRLGGLERADISSELVTVAEVGVLGGAVLSGSPLVIAGVGTAFALRGTAKVLSSVSIPPEEGKLIDKNLLRIGGGLFDIGIGASLTKTAAKTFDIIGLRELEKSQVGLAGKEVFRRGKTSVFKIKTVQKTARGKIESDLRLPVIIRDERKAFITAGKAQTRLEFETFEEGTLRITDRNLGVFGEIDLLKTTPKIKTRLKDVEAVKEIKGFETGVGTGGIVDKGLRLESITVEKRLSIKGLTFSDAELFKRKVRIDITKKPKEFEPIGISGIAKEVKGDKFLVIGGVPSKARVQKLSGDVTLTFEPKIKGLIEKFKPPKEKGFTVIKTPTGKRTPLSQTFQVEKQVQKQVQEQTPKPATVIPSVVESVSQRQVRKQIKQLEQTTFKTKTLTALSPVTKQRFPVPTDNRFAGTAPDSRFELGTGETRFKDLGVQETRFDLKLEQSIVQKTKTRTKEKLKTPQRDELRLRDLVIQSPTTKTLTKQTSKLELRLRQAQQQRQRQREKQRVATRFSFPVTPIVPRPKPIPVGVPVPPPIVIPFPKPKKERKPTTRQKDILDETLFITAGFTARALNIKRIIPKEKLRSVALKETPIGIRGIPIIR